MTPTKAPARKATGLARKASRMVAGWGDCSSEGREEEALIRVVILRWPRVRTRTKTAPARGRLVIVVAMAMALPGMMIYVR